MPDRSVSVITWSTAVFAVIVAVLSLALFVPAIGLTGILLAILVLTAPRGAVWTSLLGMLARCRLNTAGSCLRDVGSVQ